MKDTTSSSGQIKRAVQANKTQAVVVWAWIGAFCIAMAIYWIIGWMLSADFATTYPSAKAQLETPAATKNMIYIYEVGSSLTALAFFLFWFLKPKLQTRKFSFLGLLCRASLTTYTLNSAENYYSYGIA